MKGQREDSTGRWKAMAATARSCYTLLRKIRARASRQQEWSTVGCDKTAEVTQDLRPLDFHQCSNRNALLSPSWWLLAHSRCHILRLPQVSYLRFCHPQLQAGRICLLQSPSQLLFQNIHLILSSTCFATLWQLKHVILKRVDRHLVKLLKPLRQLPIRTLQCLLGHLHLAGFRKKNLIPIARPRREIHPPAIW